MRNHCILANTLILLTALPCAAQSTFFVATNGVDVPGNGGSANPWATIEYAHPTVRAAFVALVEAFGRPAAGGAGVDAGVPADMPLTDILGNSRDAAPDLGAVERANASLLFANSFEP